MKTYAYKIHLEPQAEGGFLVTVPTLPGCITWGRDFEEAVEMAHECIIGFVEALMKAGQPVPEEPVLA